MKVTFGVESKSYQLGKTIPVVWDTKSLVNGHLMLLGMSGAGKTYQLNKMVRTMRDSALAAGKKLRVYVYDVHGDIEIDGASTVRFSEQVKYGMNPLRVNPDPHYGGLRKRIQSFISTHNRVMRALGGKQEAALRNILHDLYRQHGFDQDDPSTWLVDDSQVHLIGDGSDNRLYLDVPIAEKDEAKGLGARWDGEKKCWWIPTDEYKGGITRWIPKRSGRTHPSIDDAVAYARRILLQSFMGADQKAISRLEIFNKATTAHQRKVMEMMRRGDRGASDEKLQSDMEKAGEKAIEAFTECVKSMRTGRELTDLMKYDSTDVLKSVVDRLENLSAIGIFKPTPPPFDPEAVVWRYHLKALNLEERKLFVLFNLEQIFAQAIQDGEQDDVCHLIILDEAHIYNDDDPENIMNSIAAEARKFGVAMVCASQSPTHFSDTFISCVATKIVLGIDEMYWKKSEQKMNIPDGLISKITLQRSMLVQFKEKGQARNDWRHTQIVDVPPAKQVTQSVQSVTLEV